MGAPGINLRNVPPALWRRVLGRAKRDGHELRVVLLSLLRYYADGGGVDLRSAAEAEVLQPSEDGPQPADPTRARLGEGVRRR